MSYFKSFLKKILHSIIIPFARKDNFLSFITNLVLFFFYKNYNVIYIKSNYLYRALQSNNLKILKIFLNAPFSYGCEKLLFQYIFYYRLFSEFRNINDLLNHHSLKYICAEYLINYYDQQENNNKNIIESQAKMSNFLLNSYQYDKNSCIRKKNTSGKKKILYVTGFFSQENLFKLFNSVARYHDHNKFSFYIYCSAPPKDKFWISQYIALGYTFISKSDLYNSNFDIVVDWDGCSGHVLYEMKRKIASTYLAFGNDFYPGGLHDHCITYNSIRDVAGVPSEFYIPLEDECLISFLQAHQINNDESMGNDCLKEYVGLPSLFSKISEYDYEKISWFLDSFPQKKLAFIHSAYQSPQAKMFIEEKLNQYSIDKSRITYFYDSFPEYIQRLKKMSFYFSTNPVPGGRTSLETIENGIISPYFEHKNHVYSRLACLIPKVLGLGWLVSDNDADYQEVCQKLVLLSENDLNSIRSEIKCKINKYHKRRVNLLTQSFEDIFESLV